MQRRLGLSSLCALVGVYLCASGLLRLDEVFFNVSSSKSASKIDVTTPKSEYQTSTSSAFGRLVIVLIDALRADMVLGSDAMYGKTSSSVNHHHHHEDLNTFMPYTRAQLTKQEAMGFIGVASVPTVTMPRLKALVTGKSPAFIDILKNFNSVALDDENLIQLMADHGHPIVFYGDDTWLKLFPRSFLRHDGTSGFFTRDTVEVDDNVTRHLQDELDPMFRHPQSRDWQVLVLHYLGLDHVGHLKGPRSPLMRDKLQEMDAIIKRIREAVYQQDQRRKQDDPSALPSLILLCSDHGMSEGGNHGGATAEESSALLMFLRGDARQMPSPGENVRRLQVDLVPTISTLFGLPIPRYSTGRLLQELVKDSFSSLQEYKRAIYRNLCQLFALAVIKFHRRAVVADLDPQIVALIDHPPSAFSSDHDELEALMLGACEQLQRKVLESDGSEYNGTMIVVGVLLFVTAMIGIVPSVTPSINIPERLETAVLGVGTVLQIIALSSSSSIENEHATYFYFMTSLGCVWLIMWMHQQRKLRSMGLIVILSVVCTRILRSRNQVINFGRLNGIAIDDTTPGYEYANDDSLSLLFTGPSIAWCPPEAFIGLVWIMMTYKALRRRTVVSLVLFSIAMGAAICCSLTGSASFEWIDVDTSARVVYVVVLIHTTIAIVGQETLRWIRVEMVCWPLICVLQRPSNLPTLGILSVQLAVVSWIIQRRSETPKSSICGFRLGVLCLWLMQMSFFALGNSHLVTTIDISQSYHGLTGYSQSIVGLLTFINVLSGPLMCIVYLMQWTTNSNRYEAICSMLLAQTLRFAVYSVIVYFMRFHLFIWSVFAPKMLYEVVFTVTIIFVALASSCSANFSPKAVS